MTDLVRLSNQNTVDEVVEIIERDGGVIVENYLSPEIIEELKADLLPKIAQNSPGGDDFSGFKTRRMSALFAKSRRMVEVVTHPLFLGAADRLINVPVKYWSGEREIGLKPGIRIGATQLIQIAPGETPQNLHRDHWAVLWRTPQYERHVRLQIMLAVSDFTAENGGTLVIPGSHTWPDTRVPKMDEAISTVMKAGSALLFIGSTYHGGGLNKTNGEYRTGLTVAIDAATVRQEENMYLALSPEVVKSYPVEIQRLLGWSYTDETHMGWVEIDGEMADPLRLLA
ncbi:MAG: phytanoyl-CoA dioxygenase family protein [Proteobacteria bacterium]|nr:phytanoyl-CoA dioxygenase family protein [Pseudomonadota bacterium]